MILPQADVVLITLLDGDLAQLPEHLGVSYLASELRKAGHVVEICPTWPRNEAQVVAHILSLAPKLIGFSLTTVSFSRAIRIGGQLREGLHASAHITCGGPMVTSLGPALLRNPEWSFLDSAVRGDGEVPIIQLLTAIKMGAPLHMVPSLCHRTLTGVVCNQVAKAQENLDLSLVPSRDRTSLEPYRTARIASSRGCTSRCSFCNAPNAGNTLTGKVWRGRSPENVVDEMESLVRDMGVRDFEFVDSTFEDPGGTPWAKQRIERLANLMIERRLNITFGCCVQAQNWCDDDLALIDLLRRAGLHRVLMGVESGSAETLQSWSKRATPVDNRRAISLFRSQSIYVNLGFIMFHPHATRQECMENAAFLRETGTHSLRSFCTRMEIYPGTTLLERLRNEDLLEPDYDHTLNPFAYKFLDETVARLAYAMALLAGEEYASYGTVDSLPPHLAFLSVDVLLHAEISRGLRSSDRAIRVRTEELFAEYRELCSQISEFNYNLFCEIAGHVFAGATAHEAASLFVEPVKNWYRQKTAAVTSLTRDCRAETPPAPAPVGAPHFDETVYAL